MKTAVVRKILFAFILMTVLVVGSLYSVKAADETAAADGAAYSAEESAAAGPEGTVPDEEEKAAAAGSEEAASGAETSGTETSGTEASDAEAPDTEEQASVPEEAAGEEQEPAADLQDETAGGQDEQDGPEQADADDTQVSEPENDEAPEKEADVLEPAADAEEEKETAKTVAAQTVTPSLTIEKKAGEGKYTVSVTDFPKSVSGLKAAVWSSKKGKDDLSWHEMKLAGDGKTYAFTSKIRDFKAWGKELVEVYTVDAKGKETLLVKGSFKINAPAAESLSVTKKEKEGAFSVKLGGFTSEFAVSSVKVAVWRTEKSAAKTFEMTAKGSGYVCDDILLSDFGGYSGKYHFLVTAQVKNGLSNTVKETTSTVKQTDGMFTYADKYKGKSGEMQKVYTLSLKGAVRSSGIQKVEFVVWPKDKASAKKTYTAKVNKNGIYSAEVKISSFKVRGRYKAEAYVTDQNGERTLVKSRAVMNVDGVIGGAVRVADENAHKGTFRVVLSGSSSPSGLKSIRFDVWTQSNKKDLHTYTAERQTDGTWTADVNIKNHAYNIGQYHVSAVGVMGNKIKLTRKQENFTYNAKDLFFIFKSSKGVRTIGIDNPSKTSDLKIAVWSEKGGRDDLAWYKLGKNGDQWATMMNIYNHGDTGKYNVQIYSGKTLLAEKTFTAKKGENGKYGWYYEKYNGETLKFWYEGGKKKKDLRGMVTGPYQIRVNRVCNTITIYAQDGDKGYIIPVKAFLCSVGYGDMTPTGHYKLSIKVRWHHFRTWDTYVQYACRYMKDKFFHSVTCTSPSVYALDPGSYSRLGNTASHGCIRMTVEGAKWIFDHRPLCKDIWIYDSSAPGPFGKPARLAPGVSPYGYYDPTDPAVS